MAKIIEFRVPSAFQKKATKWIPLDHKGKVLQFSLEKRKSAGAVKPFCSRSRCFRP